MSPAKLELAKFPDYLKGKGILEACGCSVGAPGEPVKLGGSYCARLLSDGSLEGAIPPGEDGPSIRRVQDTVLLRMDLYAGAEAEK